MGWDRETEKSWKVVYRIITVLLALADLAERASLRSRPILCLVLWALRPAETIARTFVLETAHDLGVTTTLPVAAYSGERAEDALRLALTFRVLAAVLDSLAALAFAQGRIFCQAGLDRLLSALTTAFAAETQRRLMAETRGLTRCAPSCPDTS
ncbi:MAG: hypothetical protein AB7P20_02755 [Rhizobiaceae bacterium]